MFKVNHLEDKDQKVPQQDKVKQLHNTPLTSAAAELLRHKLPER